MTLLAPHIGNDVSYVTQITDDIDFVWQAHYLVSLQGDFSWQAQHFVTFWEIAGARNVVFYNTKSSPRSPKRRVRDGDFMLGSWSDYRRIVFLLAEALQALSPEILSLKISWQAQYWVKLEGDFDCSGNDVSYVMRIKDAIHFAWQGQYLVKLEGGSSCCSAHWK